jgi:hypothetical protein
MLLRDLTDEELTAALDELQTNGIIEWRQLTASSSGGLATLGIRIKATLLPTHPDGALKLLATLSPHACKIWWTLLKLQQLQRRRASLTALNN